jgi:protein-S-isoprenylcysteine O-methyltransferase Ste14
MESTRSLATRRFILHMILLGLLMGVLGTTMVLAFVKASGKGPEVQQFLAYVAWMSLAGMLGALVFVAWGAFRFWRKHLLGGSLSSGSRG